MNLHESGLREKCGVYLRRRYSDVEWKLRLSTEILKVAIFSIYSSLTDSTNQPRLDPELNEYNKHVRMLLYCVHVLYVACWLKYVTNRGDFNNKQVQWDTENVQCWEMTFTWFVCVIAQIITQRSVWKLSCCCESAKQKIDMAYCSTNIALFVLICKEHVSQTYFSVQEGTVNESRVFVLREMVCFY